MPNLIRVEPEHELQAAADVMARIEEVTTQLKALKSNMVQSALTMGELLLEAKDNGFHIIAGYEPSVKGWAEWLDKGGLDISQAQSYYLMKMVSKFVHYLKVPVATLAECNMTSLKEIAAFDPETQGEVMLGLIENARNAPNAKTKEKVDALKLEAGEELFSLKAFRLRQQVINDVIEPAIEACKLEYGQVVDGNTNEVIEISDGRAIELICIEFMNSR